MTTKIKPSNVDADAGAFEITANNANNLGGTPAAEHYTEARVTITGTAPTNVGATSNGHIWFVYQ
ncbi:hypothetical protein OAU13_00120 [bacterium]|jgi:hypothetical protein|nr:hypothetical protein [bacterium]